MNQETKLNRLDPVMKMIVDAEVRSKTITRHYMNTISELTGKPKEQIEKELAEIQLQVRQEIREEFATISSETPPVSDYDQNNIKPE